MINVRIIRELVKGDTYSKIKPRLAKVLDTAEGHIKEYGTKLSGHIIIKEELDYAVGCVYVGMDRLSLSDVDFSLINYNSYQLVMNVLISDNYCDGNSGDANRLRHLLGGVAMIGGHEERQHWEPDIKGYVLLGMPGSNQLLINTMEGYQSWIGSRSSTG